MRIDANGVQIECEVAGEGAPVLLVHGWPDTHELWRHQIDALAAAGYRAIAPDLRGAGRSHRPAEVESYSLPYLVGDLVSVLDHLGVERAHVVGHDWGAALAWTMAAMLPDRVDHLAALSVGHPASFASAGFEQRRRSWYMLLFQFEGVAETWLSADDFANLRACFAHPQADEVASRLGDPDALTASLNLYRANVPPERLIEPPLVIPPVEAPTLAIWSTGDDFLSETQMTGSAEHVKGPWRYERLEGVGHWIPLEAPDRLNDLLLDFLAG